MNPEAFLAELDEFVQRVQNPDQVQPEDAQRLHALLAQAEAYLQAGRYEVAATAYERLLVIMRQFEMATPDGEQTAAAMVQTDSPATESVSPAMPAEAETGAATLAARPQSDFQPTGDAEPQAAADAIGATTPRRRTVHVERKKIRPYRSLDANGGPPVVDEIQRTPTPVGYRPLATIPAVGRPAASRRWLPGLVAILILAAVALGGLVYRDSLLGMLELGQPTVKPPTSIAAAGRPTTVATPAPAGRTPSPVKLPTNVATTHVAPTNTLSASIRSDTSTPVATPLSGAQAAATGTAVPSVTPPPTATDTPAPTDTPTATPTVTPSPMPTMIFTGPDPLAGATGVLLNEVFGPKAYYWNVGETGFSLSQIQEDKLTITLKHRNSIAWLLAAVPDTQDFFAMVTVTSPNCDGDDDFGLDFRAVNDGTQFQFGISCNGRYRVQKRQDSAPGLAVVPMHSDAIKTGPGATNELGVRAEGKQISLYVNRQYLTRVEVDTVTKGRFGAYVSASATSNLTAQFYNLIVWGLAMP